MPQEALFQAVSAVLAVLVAMGLKVILLAVLAVLVAMEIMVVLVLVMLPMGA